jgi:hypothetical protein
VKEPVIGTAEWFVSARKRLPPPSHASWKETTDYVFFWSQTMRTPELSRRGFVAGSLASAALAAWPKPAAADQDDARKNPICAFTKFLQPLSYEQLAETIARLGFDGVHVARCCPSVPRTICPNWSKP